jgi:hypothetical protein
MIVKPERKGNSNFDSVYNKSDEGKLEDIYESRNIENIAHTPEQQREFQKVANLF